jgi:hypothetical protein
VPRSTSDFDGILFLRRRDIKFLDDGVLLKVRRSKTNQYGEKKVRIPIPKIPSSPICPVLALETLFSVAKVLPSEPAFSYGPFLFVTYGDLLKALKFLVEQIGLDPEDYGTHSLRRGGATFAASCGTPAAYIKLQGDWASECYTRYIALDLDSKLIAPSRMKEGVLSGK